ncbi:MAG: glycerol-3-phosphate 1-O-acyltransferase PlsY [Alistipes sp.]|nr:glycerol-3-phosphate 1-O-acyltransferase PlsY [Alistipes sp.]
MIITYYCAIAMMIIAYLLGSIPSAVWIGKRYYGVDIREHGSKNAGATNMLRVLGRRAALPVFAIDFIKGFVAVTIVSLIKYDPNITIPWVTNLKILATIFVVLGHIFPVFANFKGGKGVATLVGAITGIQPAIMLLCFGVWFIIFMVSHYVSLASMIAGCCFPLFVGIFSHSAYKRYGDISWTFIVFSVLVALLLIWTHRKNIERLRNGSESQIRLWERQGDESTEKATDNEMSSNNNNSDNN